MKINIQKHILENALTISQPFLNKKDMSDITSHILIDAKDNKIYIKSTNYENGITLYIDECNIENEGVITINGREILNAVKALNNEELILEKLDNNLIIKQKKSKFKLSTYEHNKFPEFPNIEKLNKIDIDSNNFINSMKTIIHSIDNNNHKMELNGAYINIQDNDINIVSTDTKRLTIVNFKTEIKDEIKLIVPKKTIIEIIKLFTNEIEIYYDNSYIIFKSKNYTVFTKLINGEYPNYKKIIPTDTKFKVELNKNDIISSIKIINSASINMNMNFIKDKLKFKNIVNINDEIEANTEIDIKNNDEFEISVNSKYILDFCENIDNQNFTFSGNSNELPFIIKDNNIMTIIMPIIN